MARRARWIAPLQRGRTKRRSRRGRAEATPLHREMGTKERKAEELAGADGGAAVELNGEILVEDHSDETGAGLHLAGSPGGKSRLDAAEGLLDLGNQVIVTLHFAEPGSGFADFRRKLVAQAQKGTEVVRPDGLFFNAGGGAQGVRKGLVGGSQPDEAPLANGKPQQGRDGDHENDGCGHGLSFHR
jgi:hypothetical protein